MTEAVSPLRLDDLSLTQLNALTSVLVGLKEAGYVMEEQGFPPRFSLVPGLPLTMTLGYRMPIPGPMPFNLPVAAASEDALTEHMFGSAPKGVFILPAMGSSNFSAGAPEAPPAGPTEAEIEAAVTAACNRVLPHLPAHAAEMARPVSPAPEPAPEPAPVAESQAEPTAKQRSWTAEEETQLVQMVAEAMVMYGKSKKASVSDAAAALHRPTEGTMFRLHTKLAPALAEAIAALQAPQMSAAATHPHPTADSDGGDPPAPVAPNPAPAKNADWQAEASSNAMLPPIEAHLFALPRKGLWTMELDLEMLELAEKGWTIPEIAADLGRDGRDVTARFDLLTGFDRDTKARKFTSAALLEALRGWAKGAPTPNATAAA